MAATAHSDGTTSITVDVRLYSIHTHLIRAGEGFHGDARGAGHVDGDGLTGLGRDSADLPKEERRVAHFHLVDARRQRELARGGELAHVLAIHP